LCVKETVVFINDGSCPVHVSWIPSADNADASVRVEPKSFEVTDRTEISVRVEPLYPGRLRETLRFSTGNRDGDRGETVVYVRGTVELMPKVRVRPALAPLVNVCAGTLESYDVKFKVTSDSPFDVKRCLYEFDAVVGALNLQSDVKSFGPYGNGSTTTASLNFKTPVDTKVSCRKCRKKNLDRWTI